MIAGVSADESARRCARLTSHLILSAMPSLAPPRHRPRDLSPHLDDRRVRLVYVMDWAWPVSLEDDGRVLPLASAASRLAGDAAVHAP